MEALAFAKLNLTLEVLGRREDGYHEVKTILQTVDLADRLEILTSSKLRVECDDRSLNGEANLVWRAALALADTAKTAPRANIYIRKQIPVAMGLGGGSSDAASALVALNDLWGLGLPLDQLSRIAATVGSDVAFFLSGGTALATGRGEQITPLPPLPSMALTLVCPNFAIPAKTARMYSLLTPGHFSDGRVTRRLVEILAGGQFVKESIAGLFYNAFEAVAPQAFPEIGWLQQRINDLAPGGFRLTGAGPALFGLAPGETDFQMVADALQPYGVEVYLVHTVSPQPLPRKAIENSPPRFDSS